MNSFTKGLSKSDKGEKFYPVTRPNTACFLATIDQYYFWLCDHPGFLKPDVVEHIVAEKLFKYVLPDGYTHDNEKKPEWVMIYNYEDIYQAAQALGMASRITTKELDWTQTTAA